MQLYKTVVGVRGGSAVSRRELTTPWKQFIMSILVVVVMAPIAIPCIILLPWLKMLYELFYKLISKRKKNE